MEQFLEQEIWAFETVLMIFGAEDVIRPLKKGLENDKNTSFTIFGPSGSGKTSTILALGKELFGKELYRDRIIELNASDERGINVVEKK